MYNPIKDTQIFEFIEHLTLEDLQDIVKDIYVLPFKGIDDCISSTHRAKTKILEYVTQDYVQSEYWNKVLGEIPPHDTESSNE